MKWLHYAGGVLSMPSWVATVRMCLKRQQQKKKKNLGIKLGPTLTKDLCSTQGAKNEFYTMQMRLSRISQLFVRMGKDSSLNLGLSWTQILAILLPPSRRDKYGTVWTAVKQTKVSTQHNRSCYPCVHALSFLYISPEDTELYQNLSLFVVL